MSIIEQPVTFMRKTQSAGEVSKKLPRKVKRVALVTAPYHSGVVESAGTWLNLGFVYVAGALRAAGYEVDYYDAMALWHDEDQIRKRLEDFRPDAVASSAFTAAVFAATGVLRLAKKVNPDIVTLIGNVHATFCYDEMLRADHDVIDFVVRGEGEHTLVKLLDCLNAGDDPAKVPGLAFWRDGGVVTTPPAPMICDLDALPTAWDLVEWPIYKYRAKNDARLAIVSSSRGCTQNCSFCSQKLFWQRGWRTRSPEAFVSELAMLHEKYGVKVAMLADETPTMDRKRWERILDLMIERQPGVKLLMETRVVDIVRDEDIMDRYRLAGVEHIYVGVEAGDQATLNLFRKGTKTAQSKKAIELINGADIVSETSFVLGMPTDTKESITRTVELAKAYDPDMAFFLAIAPWPYADLYPELKDYVATKDYSKYNLVQPVVKPTNMTIEEVEKELAMASKKFFMHKFENLDKLTPWKQEFMLSVFDILMNHSYLSHQMRDMTQQSKKMPESVRNMIRNVKAAKRALSNEPIAPLP
ncbi:B12-binding domain-containing radical SAM protein [Noviherbaspirillum sp. UKPF54]|uniref:B12-binding domain-containing radical SAM protein n=1 Tax=Noviherbaspirillum sp. UKPF54 TaxID=2601898 RepID=UPI001AEF648F|nr:radical SAM protein [Noviherbaspirillum sp. UKPF54]